MLHGVVIDRGAKWNGFLQGRKNFFSEVIQRMNGELMKRLLTGMLVFMAVAIPRMASAHPGHGNSPEGASVSPGHYLVEPAHWPLMIVSLTAVVVLFSLGARLLCRERKLDSRSESGQS